MENSEHYQRLYKAAKATYEMIVGSNNIPSQRAFDLLETSIHLAVSGDGMMRNHQRGQVFIENSKKRLEEYLSAKSINLEEVANGCGSNCLDDAMIYMKNIREII